MYAGELYLRCRLRVFVRWVQDWILGTYTIKKNNGQGNVFDPKSLISVVVVVETETQLVTKPPDVSRKAKLK